MLEQHTHAPSEDRIHIEFKNFVRHQARRSHDKPSQIYAEGVKYLPDSARALLLQQDSVKRMIDRVRKEQMPAIPQSVQDFVLPDEYKVTDGLNPEPFLLYDNGPGPHSRIIAFATQGGVERFAGADTGFVDGNFKLAPKGFKQAYFIRVPYEQSSVTCVYAFLQNKTTAVYAELFDALIQKCEEMGLRVKIKTIVSDFEKGVLKAVRRTSGRDVHRQGCFFDLCQSIWRKVNNLGLAERYRDLRNGDLRFFAAKWMPLHSYLLMM